MLKFSISQKIIILSCLFFNVDTVDKAFQIVKVYFLKEWFLLWSWKDYLILVQLLIFFLKVFIIDWGWGDLFWWYDEFKRKEIIEMIEWQFKVGSRNILLMMCCKHYLLRRRGWIEVVLVFFNLFLLLWLLVLDDDGVSFFHSLINLLLIKLTGLIV